MPETAEPADTVAASAPGDPSDPGTPVDDVGRTRVSPWLMVVPWAAVTVVVLAPFVVSEHPDRSAVASVAAVALPTLVIAAICALVASRSAAGWSWWLYPPIVVLPAVALVVLTDQVPDRLENVPDAGDQGNRALSAPAQAGDWTIQTGPSVDEQEAELRKRIAGADASLEAVYGQYLRAGDDMLVYNGINVTEDSNLALELIGRPEDALGDYLDGTGITDVVGVDAGELRGAMACGTLPRLGPYVDLIVCGWADSGGIGTATYRVDGINVESAAETTRAFRDEVTVIG